MNFSFIFDTYVIKLHSWNTSCTPKRITFHYKLKTNHYKYIEVSNWYVYIFVYEFIYVLHIGLGILLRVLILHNGKKLKLITTGMLRMIMMPWCKRLSQLQFLVSDLHFDNSTWINYGALIMRDDWPLKLLDQPTNYH